MSEAPKVMWSIGQIAERDGVSRQAISKIVKKLVADHGIPVERDGRGRICGVSLAHYDHHRETYVNPAKRPATPHTRREAPAPAKDSFEEARRQKEWLAVERAKIEHQETAGKLLRRDRVDAAVDTTGREIQNLVARLPNHADDLALAVSKEGVHGLRVALKKIAFDLNGRIADRMAGIAGEAPAEDHLVEAEDEAA